MRSIATLATAATLAASALGSVLPFAKRADKTPELEVTLSQVKDTQVKAVVKNVGEEEVSLLNFNFFKNKAPVKKAGLFREGTLVVIVITNC